MMIAFALRRTILAAVLLSATTGASAAVSFHLKVTTDREAAPQTKNPSPAHEVRESDVILGKDYISVSEGKQMTVLDFSIRRRYVIDKDAASYVEYSLFDTVGFRQMELHNRHTIAGALAAAKVEMVAPSPVYEEQALSMMAGKQPRTLTRAGWWSVDEQPLLRMGAGGSPIDMQDSRAFAQFLRYTWGGHPLLLDAIANGKQLPAQFELLQRQIGGRSTQLFQISAVATDTPVRYSLHAYRPRQAAATSDPMEKVLDRAAALPPIDAQALQRMQADMQQRFAAQQPFEALLTLLQTNLSASLPPPVLTAAQKAMLQGNAQVQQLMQVLDIQQAEQSEHGANSLQALSGSMQVKAPVLQVFEANLRVKARQWPQAQPLYLAALQADPHLAGAYKDMGDALYVQFDTAGAWRSWDAGRRLSPGLEIFSSVNQYEQNLLKNFPEFF